MVVAGHNGQARVEEELPGLVGMQQADQFVAATPLAMRGLRGGHAGELLLGHGSVVGVEEQPRAAFVVRIVGHEEVGAVCNEEARFVEKTPLAKDALYRAVVPRQQFFRGCVARDLAQKVLVARGVAHIVVLGVEPGTLDVTEGRE